jgi:cytochrome c oxidase subunit II
MPEQASTIAGDVDRIYYALTALSLIFALPVAILIIYFAVKYRRGANVDRTGALHESTRLEMSWIITLLLLSLGVFGWGSRVYVNMYAIPEDGMDIYVVGLQWMWQFEHPTGAREINTLHVPVGRTVRLTMISQDVIHSFYVPAFRIKRDVLPGRYSTAWFQATQTGEYHLFCAEFCGAEHSGMVGSIVVMEQSAYENWLNTLPNQTGDAIPQASGAAASASQGPQTMTQAGEALFQNSGCTSCHQMDGNGVGPSLVGLYGSQVELESGEVVNADADYIRHSILEPNAQIVAGYPAIMPTYADQLDESELMQLVEYISSLGSDNSTQAPGSAATPDESTNGSRDDGSTEEDATIEGDAGQSPAAGGGDETTGDGSGDNAGTPDDGSTEEDANTEGGN